MKALKFRVTIATNCRALRRYVKVRCSSGHERASTLSFPATVSFIELELEFFLRSTVSRPIRLGIGPPFGTLDQILSCSFSFVWQLRRFAINASSLTRKRVCNLLLNCFCTLPEQSHLSRSPTELTDMSYCLIWDSPNLEGQVPVFISPRNRVAQLYSRALGCVIYVNTDTVFMWIYDVQYSI
jgi:hypothetical protein